jgi:hypothetical protein
MRRQAIMARNSKLHYKPNTFAQTFFISPNYPLALPVRTICVRWMTIECSQ